MKVLRVALVLSLLAGLEYGLDDGPAWAQETAAVRVEAFSPQGEAKDVRQVVARFSQPMVAFGDPRLDAPFDVQCSAKGRGRWADARNWIYDFEYDLPAGEKCTFSPKAGLKSQANAHVEKTSFGFTTGGPAIRVSHPAEGIEYIDEEQVFLLGLDAPADLASVKQHAACAIEGIGERIPLEIIEGSERDRILAEQSGQARNIFEVLTKRGRHGLLAVKDKRLQNASVIVAHCGRKFPTGSRISLLWGKGIRTLNDIPTSQDQTLNFRVREDFAARSNCTRINPKAGCVPVLPITLSFTAPVARELAEKIVLQTADGEAQHPLFKKDEHAPTVGGVSFAGPFPAQSQVTVKLPWKFRDDAGRSLANAAAFPLKIRIDSDPPLIKFPSRFGILELNAQPMLPVSIRNVEATLKGAGAQFGKLPGEAASGKGQLARLDTQDDAELAQWFFRITRHPNGQDVRDFHEANNHYPREGEMPLLLGGAHQSLFSTTPLSLPRPHGDKPFELIGIPLQKPGFYIVEFASDRLGAALHGEHKPYYVSSSALVTNMAVHLKKGRESSLVWVTRLDNAQPVAGAAVRVSTCDGRMLWEGQTDAKGMAHIEQELEDGYFGHCSGLMATARKDGDLSFVMSTWDDGISPWQFNLGGGAQVGPVIAHTVFDRPLFRAGETVSMKHFVRIHTGKGFDRANELPDTATVTHEGSGQSYEVDIDWSEGEGLSSWAIPREAKLGTYTVSYKIGQLTLSSGSFRVEQYRVPLMKAVLKPPAQPLVNGSSLVVDAQLNLLAGGAAAGAPVKFRSRLVRYALLFPEYDDFGFGGSMPKVGIEAVEPYSYDPEEDSGDMPQEGNAEPSNSDQVPGYPVRSFSTILDANGGARVTFDKLPRAPESRALEVEMEYSDPNGQILTAATHALVLPSAVVLGMKVEGYFATKERLAFKVLALTPMGKPIAGQKVAVEAYSRKTYAYRKRMLGGFYSYEQTGQVERVGAVCSGNTDARGMLLCDGAAPESGELILVAHAKDGQGNAAFASRELYVADEDNWFTAGQSDRIDLLADKRAYEPGDKARLEVRMPFREATALVTVEREGILASFVQPLSAKSPFVDVPIAQSYGPNAYVSVMVVRGRVDPEVPGRFAWLKRMIYRIGMFFGLVKEMPHEIDTRPTALVDLTKPAFKLGLTQIRVGWQGYALKVKVEPDRAAYKVRDKASVKITVTDPAGKPAANAEIALAAVDEGLLQLAPPTSWELLEAMMQRRPIEVRTATAQSQVIGKRHFGKKAAAPGGGGGQGANARELFDTLLLWQPRIKLDAFGRARVTIPLNDSLTSFRIAAIAHSGAERFGSGSATIRSAQEVMLFAGLPPFVREGDQFAAMVTLRNGGERPLTLDVSASADAGSGPKPVGTRRVSIKPGEGATVSFPASAPFDARKINWLIGAQEVGNVTSPAQPAHDTLKFTQAVGAAYPVRVYQQTLEQLEPNKPWAFPVQRPAGAIPGRGGIEVRLANSLGGDLDAVREWMLRYPFICIEQRASVAIATEDEPRWNQVMNTLPLHLDGDGLVKYFPMDWLEGDDQLTAYLLTIANEAGYEIPEASRERMLKGLEDFVAGRIHRYGQLQTADVVMRKLAAIDALARYGHAKPEMLEPLEIAPNLWPSSGVIDWISVLTHMKDIPEREDKLAQASQILRSRLFFSGTLMSFSTEKQDYLWWLMVSPDLNAVRSLRLLADDPGFQASDVGRLARGALARQAGGHWNTTLANAWGVVALKHFREKFEREPVHGTTVVKLGTQEKPLVWAHAQSHDSGDPTLGTPIGPGLDTQFAWPAASAPLSLQHRGGGKPWAFVASRAALPLEKPLFAGYSIKRTITPIEQKTAGVWQRGDTYRIKLDIDAQADMTWVVVNDPAPAGATVLGTGLGGDSALLASGEKRKGWQWPAFEERAFDGYRAYYEYVPKGRFSLEYTVRLNNPGRFEMPATRVEAMYAPEIFGELPVARMEVKPQ